MGCGSSTQGGIVSQMFIPPANYVDPFTSPRSMATKQQTPTGMRGGDGKILSPSNRDGASQQQQHQGDTQQQHSKRKEKDDEKESLPTPQPPRIITHTSSSNETSHVTGTAATMTIISPTNTANTPTANNNHAAPSTASTLAPPSSRPGSRGGSSHHLTTSYSPHHASSVPVPRPSLIRGMSLARVTTEQVRGGSARRDNMPAVSELLHAALSQLPMRSVLLPNFYRSSGAYGSGVIGGGGAGGSGGSIVSKNNEYSTPIGTDEESLEEWSDEEEEINMDEDEHRETMDMLQELTMLSLPSGNSTVDSATHGNGTSKRVSIAAGGERKGLGAGHTSSAAGETTSSHKQNKRGAPSPSGGAAASSTVTSSTTRKAHITPSETLFHGFYAKRCIHTVKKSMASSGMFLLFKDWFEKLDTTRSGMISRNDWAKLLQKLGLPVDSATSLSRLIGLAGDTPTITLEQFAMVMALSMHGPYVRLLQTTQSTRRNEVFLGGDLSGVENVGTQYAASLSSSWRKEASTILKMNHVPCFNPEANRGVNYDTPFTQIAQSSSTSLTPTTTSSTPADELLSGNTAERVILEALAKTQCSMMLFVVDHSSRSIASMIEASEYITSEKEVLLVMEDVKAGSMINGETLTNTEAKDLNRGRAYLTDVAHRNAHSGVLCFKSVSEACLYIAKRNSGEVTRPSLKAFTKPVIALPTAAATKSTTSNAATATSVSSVTAASSKNGLPPIAPKSIASSTSTTSTATPSTNKTQQIKSNDTSVTSTTTSNSNATSTDTPTTTSLEEFTSSLTSKKGGFTVLSGSPLGLSLLSSINRRHSGGGGAFKLGGQTMNVGMIPAVQTSSSAAPSPVANSLNSAFSNPTSPITLDSSSFSSSEWPALPQSSDFSRYLSSAHFLECTKTVWKHQGLLARRAAVKAAAAMAVNGGGTGGSGNNSPPSMVPSLSLPSPTAKYDGSNGLEAPSSSSSGLFRMASSPTSRLTTSAIKSLNPAVTTSTQTSGNTIAVLTIPPSKSDANNNNNNVTNHSSTPPPIHHHSPSNSISSPLTSPSSGSVGRGGKKPIIIIRTAASNASSANGVSGGSSTTPTTPGGSNAPLGSYAASSSTAATEKHSPPVAHQVSRSSTTLTGERDREHTTLLSDSFVGGSSIAQSLSQSRVLLSMPSQSENEHSSTSAGDRPDTSGETGVRSAGVSRQNTSEMGAASSAAAANPAPATSPQLDSSSITPPSATTIPTTDDTISSTHLFTMLIRLHEIIQLSTGIIFRVPYIGLLDETGSEGGEGSDKKDNSTTEESTLIHSYLHSPTLHITSWIHLSRYLFTRLGGVKAEGEQAQIDMNNSSGTASMKGALGLGSMRSRRAAALNQAAESQRKLEQADDSNNNKYTVTVNASPSPSIRRYSSNPRASGSPVAGGSSSTGGSSGSSNNNNDLAPPPPPLTATGISPSQFLRHLSTQGPRRASNGTSAASAGAGVMISVAGDGNAASNSTTTATPNDTLSPTSNTSNNMTSSTTSTPGSAQSSYKNPYASGAGAASIFTTAGGATSASTSDPATPSAASDPPQRKSLSQLTNSVSLIQKVKSRISSQKKVIDSMTPLGVKSVLDEANTLSTDDMNKLNISIQASLQHDQLLLKEMIPSFKGMFEAIVSLNVGESKVTPEAVLSATISTDEIYSLLDKKLLLPEQSCQALMSVMNVALQTCREEAAATAVPQVDSNVVASPSTTTYICADLPSIHSLPLSSLTPHSLTYSSFCSVLSKTLHLQSSPFSSFLSATPFHTLSKRVCSQVFLGGSCNPTTWRMDEAIPILSSAGITTYNPQVDNWSTELVLIESLIKQNCEILLFVIDSETRAIASMIEASEYICSGRDVVLVVKHIGTEKKKQSTPVDTTAAVATDSASTTAATDDTATPKPILINNDVLLPRQIHDLNHARSYVTDVAQRHGLDVFTDITLACEYIVTKLQEKQQKEEAYFTEVEAFIASDEFLEKTLEEFYRCDIEHAGVLNKQQLLLACLHLEQDLRPLLPPQSASKYRQPSMMDVEIIMKQFCVGGPTAAGTAATTSKKEMTCDQFLDFSRVLFRNVCATVKF